MDSGQRHLGIQVFRNGLTATSRALAPIQYIMNNDAISSVYALSGKKGFVWGSISCAGFRLQSAGFLMSAAMKF